MTETTNDFTCISPLMTNPMYLLYDYCKLFSKAFK